MVVRRSQGAGKPEQSSQRYAFLKGIPSWFALLLLLLGSLYFIPVILRNDLSSVICIVHAPQKERFSRRNQYNYYFNIPKTNKNLIRQCNRDSGEYGLKYHLATTISKTYRPCNGLPQIMPPRRAKEKIGDQTEHWCLRSMRQSVDDTRSLDLRPLIVANSQGPWMKVS